MKVGLTNYASSYATGLLLARRVRLRNPSFIPVADFNHVQVLTKLNLASAYAGQEKPDGAEYHVEAQV